MNLTGNKPALFTATDRADKILDVGGWFQPFNRATHVLDIMPFETRHRQNAIDPEHDERFSADTWTMADACVAPWPFPDKYFDYSFCSHTLEDVRDPLVICKELVIFVKSRFFGLNVALGRIPEIGHEHHRWFVEVVENHVVFTAKDFRLMKHRGSIITRSDIGRKLNEIESGTYLFWENDFTYEEHIIKDCDELKNFRSDAIQKIRRCR